MTIKDGIYAASMSVLNADLKLNSKQTLIHAEKLISLGAEGVVLGGSTGQSQSLSNECKMNLIDQASKSLQNPANVRHAAALASWGRRIQNGAQRVPKGSENGAKIMLKTIFIAIINRSICYPLSILHLLPL